MDIHEAIHLIHDKIFSWLKQAVSHVPNLLIAILVVALFGAASGYIKKAVMRLMSRVTGNASLVNLTSSFLRLFVIAVGIFVGLNILGLNQAVTSLLAGAGIIGLALGFAFQDLTANFLSGAFIAIQQPIRVGDVVETNGYFGMVKAINIRSTIIDNFGGQEIEIPSRDIFQKPIVNFSKSNQRRMQLNCGVSYDDDLQKAQDVAMAAIVSLPFLQPGKPVEFHYQNFSDRSITFLMWFWIDQAQAGPPQAMSDAIKAIKKAFGENGIVIPFPIQTLEITHSEDIQKPLVELKDNKPAS